MKYFDGTLVRSFLTPKNVFEELRMDKKAMGQYNLCASLLIYLVGYFSIMPILFKMFFFSLGIFSYLLGIFFVILFSSVKIFLYSFIISQKKAQFISFQEMFFINTLGNIRLVFFFPLLYILSYYVSTQLILLLLIIISISMLSVKNTLFRSFFDVKARFVYYISFFMWFLLLPFTFLVLMYLGMTIAALI